MFTVAHINEEGREDMKRLKKFFSLLSKAGRDFVYVAFLADNDSNRID